VSIFRIRTLVAIGDTDPSWTILPGAYWTIIEATVGIICANLPMVRAYLTVVAPTLFSTTHATNTRQTDTPAAIGGSGRHPDGFELVEGPLSRERRINDVEQGGIKTKGEIQSESWMNDETKVGSKVERKSHFAFDRTSNAESS
jgi:hypothetical protein